jgi:hypothetical protein
MELEPVKSLDTRYQVFRLNGMKGNLPQQQLANLEICHHETFASRQEAENWILKNGNFRTLNYEYIVLPCIRVVAVYK